MGGFPGLGVALKGVKGDNWGHIGIYRAWGLGFGVSKT